MPNWCYTSYAVEGPADKRKALYDTMKQLQEMPVPGLQENGFGSSWLGNLVVKLGGDWEKIRCRGSWDDLQEHENHISFTTETAWCECSDVRHLLEEKFDVDIFFASEECGMGIYETNDASGTYFPDRYVLWIEDEDQDYYEDLSELIAAVKEIVGEQEITTFEDCDKALQDWSEANDDKCFTLAEFYIVD